MAKRPRGIYADARHTPKNQLVDKVADFAYESPVLAQLIVDIWGGQHADLLKAPNDSDYGPRSDNAKALLASKGFFFMQPIVITEDEYEDGFNLNDAGLNPKNAVVFVVPRVERLDGGPPLLETAKMRWQLRRTASNINDYT